MRAAAGLLKTKTLSVRERPSGRLFLADSGADVSVFPATESDKLASKGSCSGCFSFSEFYLFSFSEFIGCKNSELYFSKGC